MPGLVQNFENEADRAEDKTREQRADGSLPVQTRPENSENEAHGNRRTDVRLHALQVDIKLRTEKMYERHPQKAENDHGAGGHSSESDQLQLRGGGAELFVKVQRDHRRCGI